MPRIAPFESHARQYEAWFEQHGAAYLSELLALRAFAEAYRVLRPGGRLVVGFIDRASALGQEYLAHRAENVFYREATFNSVDDVEGQLRDAGFGHTDWGQTLSRPLSEIREIEPLRPGRGRGAFVVASAHTARTGVRSTTSR